MSNNDSKTDENLTRGPLARHLLRLTTPMIVGVLAVMSIGLADAYFIGQYGELELAAISFVFPVTTALTSLGIGLSAGANALVSQALGRDDDDEARRYAAQSIVLTLLGGVIVAGLGLLLWDKIFVLLQARPEVLQPIGQYMRVWFPSFVPLMLLLVSNATIRANGNTLLPSAVMVLNALLNIGLDPLLIFGWGAVPPMGIAGAATATLIAMLAAALVMCWPLFRTVGAVRPGDFLRRGYLETARALRSVGGPAALANALNPAGLSIVMAIVARFGPAAVAGFGVAGRIESFVLVPLLALSGSIGPLVGQNFGAGDTRRASRAVALAVGFCAVYGLAVAVVLTTSVDPLVALFTESRDAQDAAALCLRIVSWSLFAYGVLIVINASFNARSMALASMSLSLARIVLVYIPLALVGASLFGLTGVFIGTLIANLGGGIAAVLAAMRYDLFPRPGGDI